MTTSLTQFRIEQLHGKRTISIPISDNRLILIGENGTGKSTVANLIYYFLTRQWQRLRDYNFRAIEVSVAGQFVRFTHEDLQLISQRNRVVHDLALHFGARRGTRRVFADLDLLPFPEGSPGFDQLAAQLAEDLEIPVRAIRDVLAHYKKDINFPQRLARNIEALKALDFGQFLYLPTYRRIEQDLKSIFRGIEIEDKVREFRERIKGRKKSAFVELIEFGMEDVENTITSRMARIKESVRTGLNNLTGTYLREVLRGLDDPSADVSMLTDIDPKVFGSIFARIDEATLPTSDKALLQDKIKDIARGYGSQLNDRVIAHFLSKLVALYKEQQDSETDVREFVQVCNAYLSGKEVIYDDVNYVVYIRQESPDGKDANGTDRLELRMLSSGEKQIVSLFSHIYFSGSGNYFVVIDEPELSLSVPWQQRFLPDIINTGRCTGMIAVTHSPFIWENQLESYVRTLTEFIT